MEFVDNHCKAAPCAGNRRIMTKYGRGYSLCCSRRSERTAQLLQGSYACRQYAIQKRGTCLIIEAEAGTLRQTASL